MDITFDDIVGLLTEIVDWFESVAPTVWQIMMKKTMADAIVGVVSWAVVCAIYLPVAIIIRKKYDDMYQNDTEFFAWMFWVLGGTLVLILTVLMFDSIKMLMAPEYYTIKLIFDFVR